MKESKIGLVVGLVVIGCVLNVVISGASAQEREAKPLLPGEADVKPIIVAMSSGKLDALSPFLHSQYFDQIPVDEKSLALEALESLTTDLKLFARELLSLETEIMAIAEHDEEMIAQMEKEGGRIFPKPLAKVVPTADGTNYDFSLLIGREDDKWVACLPTFAGITKARAAAMSVRVKSDLQAIQSALRIYESKCLRVPSTAQGLQALVEKPTIAPLPRRWSRMMAKVPLDPWGNPYAYRMPGIKNPGSYDLFSYGPDGKESADDIHAKTALANSKKIRRNQDE